MLDNGSDVTDIDVTGCVCTGLGRSFVQVLQDVDDDGEACNITDLNISSNGTALAPLLSQSDVVEVRCNGTSVLTLFHIDNNVMADGGTGLSSGNGVRVNTGEFGFGTTSSATATGTINGNDIDDLGDGSNDNGIEIQIQESTSLVVQIDGNDVDGQFDNGMRVRLFDDGTADVTITNNDVGTTTANGGGIYVQTRSEITSQILCLDMRLNDVGAELYELIHDTGTFSILNLGAGGPFTPLQTDTFIELNNTGTSAAARNHRLVHRVHDHPDALADVATSRSGVRYGRAVKRVAIITGASSGIGRALAKQLSSDGYAIGLTARRGDLLAELADEIGDAGGTAGVAAADVADREAHIGAIRALAEELGPVDLLVANAGVGFSQRVTKPNAPEYEAMLRVNLLGPYYGVEAVLPSMLERRTGHLVAVSSLAAYISGPGAGQYAATKAALSQWMRAIRLELAWGPGFTRPPFIQASSRRRWWPTGAPCRC